MILKRKTVKILVYLIYILITSMLIYLCCMYIVIFYILCLLAVLRIGLWGYLSVLRRKRNRVDFTTQQGKEEIQRLNSKIDKWNGY